MKNTLFKINENYLNLMTEIEQMEGEITPEIESKLVINENELQEKSIAYLSVIKSKENVNLLLDEEIKRLQQIKKQNNKTLDYLKDRLLNAIEFFGKFEVGFTKFGIRKSKQTIVNDVNLLPKKYKITKVVESADKKLIKKDLENGIKIPNCEIKEINNLKIN